MSLLLIIFVITFNYNNEHNSIISSVMNENTAKWRALDLLMKSGYIKDNTIIRAPRYAFRVWHTPNYEGYWNSFINIIYNKNVKLLIENNDLSINTSHFIDYKTIDDNTIAMYGNIKDKEYLESILSKGSENAYLRARKTLSKVYRKVGFIPKK